MDTPPRRVVWAVIVAVVVLLGVAGSFFAARTKEPATATTVAPRTVPVVRLRRGAPPARSREAADPVAAPSREPRGSTPDAASLAAANAPRPLTLEDLDPAARDALGHTAMDRLHALVADCESTLTAPQDLGAFITLDHRGVVEVALRPIATDPGPIAVQDGELPTAIVDCLDDSLWDQDWSDAAAAVPEGAELPIALTMRLGR